MGRSRPYTRSASSGQQSDTVRRVEGWHQVPHPPRRSLISYTPVIACHAGSRSFLTAPSPRVCAGQGISWRFGSWLQGALRLSWAVVEVTSVSNSKLFHACRRRKQRASQNLFDDHIVHSLNRRANHKIRRAEFAPTNLQWNASARDVVIKCDNPLDKGCILLNKTVGSRTRWAR